MASTVSLDLDDKTFDVLKCLCKCEQKFDQNGNASSGVTGGYISLLIQGSDDDTFASWISDPQATKDGTLTLSIDDSAFKKIEFKNAYLIKMHESFHVASSPILERWDRNTTFDDVSENFIYEEILDYMQKTGIGYMIQCTISAGKISIDGIDHDNNW